MLLEEFLKPSGITQKAFAEHIGITRAALSEIIKGKRSVTVRTAQLLSMALGTTPEFWLNLQQCYDLAAAPNSGKRISVINLVASRDQRTLVFHDNPRKTRRAAGFKKT